MKPARSNQPGPHRTPPPCPPIDPSLVYPIRRLGDWGFGARSVAAMQKAGLEIIRYSKFKFIRGEALIRFLSEQSNGEGAERAEADWQSGDA